MGLFRFISVVGLRAASKDPHGFLCTRIVSPSEIAMTGAVSSFVCARRAKQAIAAARARRTGRLMLVWNIRCDKKHSSFQQRGLRSKVYRISDEVCLLLSLHPVGVLPYSQIGKENLSHDWFPSSPCGVVALHGHLFCSG